MNTTRFVWGLALLCVSFVVGLQAQDATGKIAGIVTDPSGAVVANAKVTVTNVETGASKTTATDKQGYYQVLQLPVARYEVSAEAQGFARTVAGAKALEINQTLRIDLNLQVGTVANTITVEAGNSVVETENATVGATVTGVAVAELPLNGRNTLDLLATQPGVTPTNPDSGAAGAYSIGGGRTDSVTYLLDGGLNNNLLSNAIVVNPNPDAIGEFRVLESNYGAEYGRNAGGIVSVVTKSGTNSLHGTLYDYLRNEDLNANSFFNNQQGIPRAVLKRNQFGGTIGGPIFLPKVFDGRNKLFFFFSYQGQRQTANQQQGKVTTFTPAEASGDFSKSVNGGPDPAVVSFLQANPYFQPNPALQSQGIIAPNRVDPIALKYFSSGLIPTSPTGFLFPGAGATDNIDEYLGKIDYNITPHDTLTATFTARDYPRISPFNQSNISGYPVSRETKSYFATTTYTRTITPTLLNELRVTAQRNNNLNAVPIGTKPGPAQLGVGITPDVSTGPPLLGFLGKGLNIGYSPNGPTRLVDNTYAFSDNVSWTKGKHAMKFGFLFSPYQNNTVYGYYLTGEFFFYGPSTSTGTGNDFADFLLGLPDELFQAPNAPSNIRSNSYAVYGQDSWHVTRRLTLTYGLRYEYAQPKYDTQGRSFSVIPGLQSTVFPNAPKGLVFPGDKGAPVGSNFPDKNDFAPRFGFAWDVFGNAKTSVRGGVGVFYDILKGEDNLQFNGQTPFFASADLYFNPPDSGTYTSNPGFLSNPYPASGTPNPFPSRPVNHNINFNDAGFLPFGGINPFFVNPHLRTPYVFQYNLSIQQQLASNMSLEVGYVGYSAHKLTSLQDVNPFKLGTNVRVLNTADTQNFSYINEFENIVKANYNALQTNLTKHMSSTPFFGNTFFTVAYTWSHEIDNASGFRQRNSVVPFYQHSLYKASGDTDVRQFFSLSGGWDLPFEKMWVKGPKLLTKGWSLYPIVTARTGFPLDVYAGLSTSANNPGPSGVGDAGIIHADLLGKITTYDPHNTQTINATNQGGSPSTGNYYFNPNVFSADRLNALDTQARKDASKLLGQFTYGSLPRNALRGPGAVNTNLTLAKHFYFREKLDLEFRVDAFNLFNHANFSSPDTNINDPSFGQISNTADPRIVQMALHLKF